MELTFWKANNKESGAAAILQYSEERNAVFLQMMPQDGERSFDNNAKITAKLNASDLSAMLSVATGNLPDCGKDGKGLYHQNDKGSSIINLSRYESKGEFVGWYLSLSVKRDNNDTRLSVLIQPSEIEMLRVYLEESLRLLFRNSNINSRRPQEQEVNT